MYWLIKSNTCFCFKYFLYFLCTINSGFSKPLPVYLFFVRLRKIFHVFLWTVSAERLGIFPSVLLNNNWQCAAPYIFVLENLEPCATLLENSHYNGTISNVSMTAFLYARSEIWKWSCLLLQFTPIMIVRISLQMISY